MELLQESCGYIIYKNKDGLIEGYKKKGKSLVQGRAGMVNIGTGLAHITTNCKTVEEFEQLMNKPVKKPVVNKPPELF